MLSASGMAVCGGLWGRFVMARSVVCVSGAVIAVGMAGPAIKQDRAIDQHAPTQHTTAEQAFGGSFNFVARIAKALLHEPPGNAVERVAGVGMTRTIATDLGCDA
ncbi:hypothetical protein BH759_13910 [Ralstonia solanacearum]|nr:hypothetical protein BH759_13910 [Ralstonia solanacearum]